MSLIVSRLLLKEVFTEVCEMKDGDRQLDDEDLKRSHRLDLSELKAHLVQYVQPLVSEKNLHFRYSWENMTASVVEADSETVTTLMEILLSNAVELTDRGGDVILCARELWRKANLVRLEFYVQDNGAGMKSSDMEASYPEDACSRGISAVGSLASEINGILTCESSSNMGTIIRIIADFPVLADLKPAQRLVGTAELYSFTGKEVLIAEDHPLNLEITRDLMKRVGAEVITASDGMQAYEQFAACNGQLDLILMDIRMPGLDGIEATAKIRESGLKGAETVPIVALTACAYEGDITRSRSAGMNDAILKPIDPSKLYRILSKYLYN